MSSEALEIDGKTPPFDHFRNIQRLGADRGGHSDSARHHLYVARDKRSNGRVLIKLTAKPGVVYQQNLANEIASLTTINRELPDSRYFPFLGDHGTLRDGRLYLTITLFDEFPLATTISDERIPSKMVNHIRVALEVSKALIDLHRIGIFHVDLNPMNILYRSEHDQPIIRIVDFESSYEKSRHTKGVFYNPPTTAGYAAPELSEQPPDGRSDLFSLGAVLYTMIAGYRWTWETDITSCIKADNGLDAGLRDILLGAVAIAPAKRYASVKDFRARLGNYLEQIWPGRQW